LLGAGTVKGGLAGTGASGTAAQPGKGYGSAMFLGRNASATLQAPHLLTLTVSGTIFDLTRSEGPSGQTGAGSLVIVGSGTVDLAADNAYTGTTTLAGAQATLELSHADSAGTSKIVFLALSQDTLQVDDTTMPTNNIDGIGDGDSIDLRG